MYLNSCARLSKFLTKYNNMKMPIKFTNVHGRKGLAVAANFMLLL